MHHAGRPVQLYDKAITIAFDNNEFSQALPVLIHAIVAACSDAALEDFGKYNTK